MRTKFLGITPRTRAYGQVTKNGAAAACVARPASHPKKERFASRCVMKAVTNRATQIKRKNTT